MNPCRFLFIRRFWLKLFLMTYKFYKMRTTYAYDVLGWLFRFSDAFGLRIHFRYDHFGLLLIIHNARWSPSIYKTADNLGGARLIQNFLWRSRQSRDYVRQTFFPTENRWQTHYFWIKDGEYRLDKALLTGKVCKMRFMVEVDKSCVSVTDFVYIQFFGFAWFEDHPKRRYV